MVMYLGIILKRMGFETISAGNGKEAMRLVDVYRPEIIMADTGLSGFEALTALSEHNDGPEGYFPSVIMLTGTSGGKAQNRLSSLGPCAQLTKPVNPDRLHRAIQDCMFKPLGTRRKHMRANVDLTITVTGSGGEQTLTTDSLSAGGVFIRSIEPPAVGEVLEVLLPCNEELCLSTRGRVVHIREAGPARESSSLPQGFALEFLDLSDEYRARLDDFVRDLMTDGIAEGDSRSIYSALRSYSYQKGA